LGFSVFRTFLDVVNRQGYSGGSKKKATAATLSARRGKAITYTYKGVLRKPTPAEINDARICVHLTQQAAAELVHRASGARWREWEGGKYAIDLAVWELFLLKSGLRVIT
jgi:hypothetical protein